MTVATWDPTHTYSAIALTNAQLTAKAGNYPYGAGDALATAGFAANTTQSYTFTLTIDDYSHPGSIDVGLCLGSQDITQRPGDYPVGGTGATSIRLVGSHIVNADLSVTFANFGTALATGDKTQWQLSNGKLYVRVMRSGSGTWGAWNGEIGSGGTYANTDPASNNGIPLTGFGSQALFPYIFLDTANQVTADFSSWANPITSSAGTASVSFAASGTGTVTLAGAGSASVSFSAASAYPVATAAVLFDAPAVGLLTLSAAGSAAMSFVALSTAPQILAPGTPVTAAADLAAARRAEFLARLARLLPNGWFGRDGDAPVLDAQTSGDAAALAPVQDLLDYAKSQSRLATMSDGWLELAAGDFFDAFPRLAGEGDDAYSRRIRLEVLRDRNTRNAIDRAVYDLTGDHPDVFEAWRPGCTGGYGTPALAYGRTGRYGSRAAPAETIVTTPLLQNYGIPGRGGYGSGVGGYGAGNFSLVDDAMIEGSGPTQNDLVAAIDRVRAGGTTIIVRFTQPGAAETDTPVVIGGAIPGATAVSGVSTGFGGGNTGSGGSTGGTTGGTGSTGGSTGGTTGGSTGGSTGGTTGGSTGGTGGTGSTGGTSSGPYSSTGGLQAQRTSDFIGQIGVGAHTGWTSGGYSPANVISCMNYLGLKRVRDVYDQTTSTILAQCMNAGLTFNLMSSSGSPGISAASFTSAVASLVAAHPGGIHAVEGINEPDSNPSAAATFQQQLFAAIKGNTTTSGLPVYNAAMANPMDAASLGNLSAYCDYGAFHDYPTNQQPWVASAGFEWYNWSNSALNSAPGKPIVCTECGASTYDEVSTQNQASNWLNCIMSFKRQGNSAIYLYELIESQSANNNQGRFGIFTYDTLSPKPAAVAIKNMVTLLSKYSGTAGAGKLDYTVSGLTTLGSHFVLQQSDGTFNILITEQQPYGSAAANKTIAINDGSTWNVKVYDPAVSSTTTVASYTNVSSFTVPVADHMMIVELQYVGGGSGTGGTSTGGTGSTGGSTGGTTGGGSVVGTGSQARAAGDFLSMIAVNTHLAWTGTAYANLSQVIAGANYLGVTRFRDGVLTTSAVSLYGQAAAAGIKFVLWTDTLSDFMSAADSLVTAHPGAVLAIEGPNEVDAFPVSYGGQSGYAGSALFQQALYAAVKGDANFARTSVYNLTTSGPFAETNLPNLSAYCDYGNVHIYPGFGQPWVGSNNPADTTWYWTSYLAAAAKDAPGKPVVVTEYGASTATGYVNQTVQAKQILNGIMDAAKTGVASISLYELVDSQYDAGNSVTEAHFGLFNADWTPKTSAVALRNFTQILSKAPGAASFTPGSLAYTASGIPSTGGAYLLQQGDGTFDLILWAEPPIWDGVNQVEVQAPTSTVVVSLPAAMNAAIYDPLQGTTALGSFTNVTRVTASVTDHPIIVELKPAATTGGSTGGATGGGTSTPPTVVLDFVSSAYTGGSLASLTVTGTAGAVPDSTGAMVNFGPNVAKRTDLGIFVNGVTQTFVGQQGRRPLAWSISSAGGTATLTATSTGADANTPAPAIFTTDHSGSYAKVALLQQPAIGQPLTIKARVGAVSAATGKGAGVQLIWNGGASAERWYCNDMTIANPVWISDVTQNGNGQYSTLISSTKLSTGLCEIVFQRVASSQDHEVHIRNQTDAAGQQCIIGGCQIVLGGVDQPWTEVGNTAVTLAADVVTATPGSGLAQIAQGSAGFLGVELYGAAHATIGTQGWPGSAAGAVLKVGSQNVLKPNGPTAFDTLGVTGVALGSGSWRGMARAALAWDATGATLYVNGSKAASLTAGTFTPSSALQFLAGVTGQIRRIEAGPARLADADLKTWSTLENRTFVNPGLSAARWLSKVTQTFFDDFDNGLSGMLKTQSQRNYPYGSAIVMGQSYNTGAGSWVPRKHGDQSDPHGSSPINGEPEFYVDPGQTGAWQGGITVANSCAVLTVKLTNTLTSGEQAQVPTDPARGATYAFVSGNATTWQQFSQQFGIVRWRIKLPMFPGAWPAVWGFDPAVAAERDDDESYGPNVSDVTMSFHANSFQYNNTSHVNIGYNQAADFHDVTAVWVAGTIYFYFDDVLVVTQPTQGTFDQAKMYLLMNLAIQPSQIAAATAWLQANGQGQMLVDHVRVLQFAP